MIFLIESRNVIVYDDIIQLTTMVEWQDLLDESLKIIDQFGNLYKWDDTKSDEVGFIYNYSMTVYGTDKQLGLLCYQTFIIQNSPLEFSL